MTTWLSQLVFWHWFALALVLGILDVTLGANFFFVWCGLSAAVVGICLLLIPTLSWELQLLIFGIGVLASLLISRRYLKKALHLSDKPALNRRAQQYVGKIFTLETAIINGNGKVKVGDTVWLVQGQDLPQGIRVRVTGVDGVILLVEKADEKPLP